MSTISWRKGTALALMTVLLAVTGFSAAASADDHDDGDDRRAKRDSADSLTLDLAEPVESTHLLFLEADTPVDTLEKSYTRKLDRYNRELAEQAGYISATRLKDLETNKLVMYYQFETEEAYEAALADRRVAQRRSDLEASSARFDDYKARLGSQVPVPDGTQPDNPLGTQPTIDLVEGEGLGINEAIVNEGATQAELSAFMRTAGQFVNPGESEGFNGIAFHEADDGSRNFNLLFSDSVENLTVTALNYLVQPLINNGRTGPEGWGPDGLGTIGVHIYDIEDIHVADGDNDDDDDD